MKRAMLIAGLVLCPVAAVAAEPELLKERVSNLGLFAGYVVACGLASEDEASTMVARLSKGLGVELDAGEEDTLQKARATARKVKCDEGPLRDAVIKGWRNYQEAD